MQQLYDAIKYVMAPLSRRVYNMIRRSVVVIIDSSKKLQTLQVAGMNGEVLSGVEHMEPYGFTSAPHKGAEAIVVHPSGNASHSVAIVVADRNYRLQALEQGEVAIYTDEGDKIHFKRNNEIEVSTAKFTVNATEKVTMTSPMIELNAETSITANTPIIEATGEVKATGTFHQHKDSNVVSMQEFITKYNSHKHDSGTLMPTAGDQV